MNEQDADGVEHEVRGFGQETRVDCGQNKNIYGPHPDAVSRLIYCPFCGDKVDDDVHDRSVVPGEVFCPTTARSTYRYCPGCGAEVL